MKNFACISGLVAALCLGLPATGLSRDHHDHHDHGHYYCPPSGHYYRSHYYPYYSSYPFYAAPYYGYYSGPAFGVTINTSPSYHREGADDLAIDVQRALRHNGYYHGDIDGDIGPGTRAAIRQYQYEHHLEVTGRIDRSLLHSLDLD